MSDGWTPCGGRIPLCVYGYLNSPTIDVALNSIFSSSAVIDGKLRVYEVWNCRADFDRFAAEVMAPVIPGALGDRAEAPAITERELHTCYLRP